MAVTAFKQGNTITYIGLSTDTKPTQANAAQPGSFFFETDTGNMYVFNDVAGTWNLWGWQFGTDFQMQNLVGQGAGTYTSPDLVTNNQIGINIGINITAITAGSLTVTVQGKDSTSGQYYTLLASAALAATGFTRLQIGPNVAAAANSVAQTYLPRVIRVQSVVATGPATWTVGASPA